MSLRISLMLVIVLSLSSIGVAWAVAENQRSESSRDTSNPPYFYNIPDRNIVGVAIQTEQSEAEFVRNEEKNFWFFADREGIPVNRTRWGGITTLLGGPRSQRALESSISNPAEYGLDDPSTTVTIGLRDGSEVTLHLGDKNPSGDAFYGQLAGYPQLLLVAASWGDVINRLANEPPLPEWHYSVPVEEIRQVTFMRGEEVLAGLGVNEETGNWTICDLPLSTDPNQPCSGSQQADTDTIMPYIETLANPEFERVEEIGEVSEEVHQEYGVGDDSLYVSANFEHTRESGLTEVDRVSIAIGNPTEDGEGRYVLANDQPDVVVADYEWTERLLEFFDVAPEAAE